MPDEKPDDLINDAQNLLEKNQELEQKPAELADRTVASNEMGLSPDIRQVEMVDRIAISASEVSVQSNQKHSISQISSLLPERFELLGELGKGGMGVVYKARNRFTNKIVAIKIIEGANADSQEAQRLLREAQAASSIKHEGATSILDFGIHNRKPYLVMECLSGVTLDKYLKDKRTLDDSSAIAIAKHVCSVMKAAHAVSVIHRDLKPSNIMVKHDAEGGISANVLDFGLAKIIDITDSQSLTQTGDVLGTPLYMSPEQCNGIRVDQRSDIYSFGVVLYHCLTGNPPHKGENIYATIFKKLNEDAPEFKTFGVDSSLENLVRKCMEVDPKDRYQNADEILSDLKKVEEGQKLNFKSSRRVKLQDKFIPYLTNTIAAVASYVQNAKPQKNATEPISEFAATETQWRKLHVEGQHYFDNGEVDKAKQTFSTALSMANQLSDQLLIRISLTELVAIDYAMNLDSDACKHQQELVSLLTGDLKTQSLREDLDNALNKFQNQSVDSMERPQLNSLITNSLNMASHLTDNREASEPLLSRCRLLIEKSLGSENRTMARCLFLQAGVSLDKGDYEQGIIEAKGSLDILNKIRTHDDDLLTVVHLILGMNYSASANRLNEAEASFLNAIETAEKTFDLNSSLYPYSKIRLAELYSRYGKFAKAKSEIESVLPLQDKNAPQAWLIEATSILSQLTENKESCRNALDMLEHEPNPDFTSIAKTLIRLAKLSIESSPLQARAYLNRATAIGKQQIHAHAKDSIQSDLFEVEAELERSKGDLPASELAFKKSLQIRERLFVDGYPVLVTLNNLSSVLIEEGKSKEAQSCLKKAIALLATNTESFDYRAKLTQELYERYIKLLNSTSQFVEAKLVEQEYQQLKMA